MELILKAVIEATSKDDMVDELNRIASEIDKGTTSENTWYSKTYFNLEEVNVDGEL